MMTHGWRRHKMENVLRTPSLNFTNYIEKGQTISGRIMGFFGANVKKGPICVLAPKYNIIATTETDEKASSSSIPHSETARHSLFRHAPRKDLPV